MEFDTLHLQVPYLSQCQFNFRLQEDQGVDSHKEKEENVQQPVFRIGGSWRDWEGYPDITW